MHSLSVLIVLTAVPAFADFSEESRKYLDQCQAQGVSVPTQLDCRKGTVVPVFQTQCVNGKPQRTEITEQNYAALSTPPKKISCDKPSYLHVQRPEKACVPGSRIQYLAQPNGTQCMFFCRREELRPAASDIYDDVNMICYQPSNGATCFFNSADSIATKNLLGPAHDARWAPPSYVADHRGGNCIQCHDSGPFVVSPFLADLEIVPSTGGLAPKRNLRGPYLPVGLHDAGNPFNQRNWTETFYLRGARAAACTQCHRIGSQLSCSYFTSFMTGTQGRERSPHHPAQHFACAKPPESYMPPGGMHDPESLAAVRFIAECCAEKNKGAPSSPCNWQRAFPPPAVKAVMPKGREKAAH